MIFAKGTGFPGQSGHPRHPGRPSVKCIVGARCFKSIMEVSDVSLPIGSLGCPGCLSCSALLKVSFTLVIFLSKVDISKRI